MELVETGPINPDLSPSLSERAMLQASSLCHEASGTIREVTSSIPMGSQSSLYDWLNPRSYFQTDAYFGAALTHSAYALFKQRFVMDLTGRAIMLFQGGTHKLLADLETKDKQPAHEQLANFYLDKAKEGLAKSTAISVVGGAAAVAATSAQFFNGAGAKALDGQRLEAGWHGVKSYLSTLNLWPWSFEAAKPNTTNIIATQTMRSCLFGLSALSSAYQVGKGLTSRVVKLATGKEHMEISSVAQPAFQLVNSTFLGLGYYIQSLRLIATGEQIFENLEEPRPGMSGTLFKSALALWGASQLYMMASPWMAAYKAGRDVGQLKENLTRLQNASQNLEKALTLLEEKKAGGKLSEQKQAELEQSLDQIEELKTELETTKQAQSAAIPQLEKQKKLFMAQGAGALPIALIQAYFILVPFALSSWAAADYTHLLFEN